MGAAVAADGDRAGAFAARQGGEGAAERIGVGLGQRVADDSADVIFAKDGGVEIVGHERAQRSSRRVGSTSRRELGC